MWQDLIANLKERSWPEAEKAKHAVEQAQREKKKQMDKDGEVWETRLFEVYKKGKDYDYWKYKHSLEDRDNSN